MAVTTDIVRSWRRPRAVIRAMLDRGRREDRALAILMAACLLIFVAQWPRLSREAFYAPEVPLDARIGATLLAWLFIAPLFFYLLGGVTHLVFRVFRGRGSWYSARLALFWTLLCTSPLFLLHGMVAGFIGPGAALDSVGLVLVLAFSMIWGMTLFEAEQSPERPTP